MLTFRILDFHFGNSGPFLLLFGAGQKLLRVLHIFLRAQINVDEEDEAHDNDGDVQSELNLLFGHGVDVVPEESGDLGEDQPVEGELPQHFQEDEFVGEVEEHEEGQQVGMGCHVGELV